MHLAFLFNYIFYYIIFILYWTVSLTLQIVST